MKKYIVFDLEWNQSPNGKAASVPELPFEIIEIGAVRLNEDFSPDGEFHRLIRPQVYKQLHYVISDVTHLTMEELQAQGVGFPQAAREFFAWCGPDAVFCSWGNMDLTELQRNLAYYGLDNPFPRPLFYYDVQKLFCLSDQYQGFQALDAAVHGMELAEDRPFHRAADDAWYTGRVLARLDFQRLSPYVSVDYYRLPEQKKEEIYLEFPDYSKYVSRPFSDKETALTDRGVTALCCPVCGRALRKKVRWFTPNQRIYFALAGCAEHGYVKGKIRIKKADEERIYVVKTWKLTDDEGAAQIMERRKDVSKKRAQRNRMKKQKNRPD